MDVPALGELTESLPRTAGDDGRGDRSVMPGRCDRPSAGFLPEKPWY
ncbi:hypothetical protein STRIP9103_01777 [Streptomyces ipomoeae 91-03]|uniref:Uncharacterized protein n=1 Tax=Streptomyces ipomoeae 91-03 TaxID=698759 RepID=L1KYQ8_9ACTN|nr:hypothetical protein STRIP9103_01777 [Streptomyces ipomoeae 91-03]